MGKGKTNVENATAALNSEDESLTSNKAGAAIPSLIGEGKTAIRWMTPIYGQRTIKVPSSSSGKKGGGGKKGGSNMKDEYHGTFAGCLGEGVAHSLEWIDVAGKRVWSGGITFSGDDYADIDLISVGRARFYFGTETQIADPDLEAFEPQPGYRGFVFIVFIDAALNTDGGTNMPSVEICWRRLPNQDIISGGPSANDGAATANPITAGAELLRSWSWANLPSTAINSASFQATAESLYAEAVEGTNRHYTSVAPLWNERMTLRAALGELSSISKAWLRFGSDGKIECGRWLRGGSIDGVTSLTHHDCDKHRIKTADSDKLNSSFIVEYRNCQRRHNSDTVKVNNPAGIKNRSAKPKQVQRSLLIWEDQAKSHGTELLRDNAAPTTTATLTVRRAKSYHADGKPIRPGDYILFPITEPDETPDVRLWRVVRRSFDTHGPVEIIAELETNGALQALPATVPAVEVAPVTPPVHYSRVLALSPETDADLPPVAVLAARPSDTASTYDVRYSDTLSGDYATIGSTNGWALPMSLVSSLDAVADTVRLKLLPIASGINPQRDSLLLTNWNGGEVEARNDELFLVLLRKDGSGNIVLKGDETQWVEIMSIAGPATAVDPDTFDVPVLRSRRGTTADVFTAGSFPDVWTNYEAWVIPETSLEKFLHKDFPGLIADDAPAYLRIIPYGESGDYDPDAAWTERVRRVTAGEPLGEFTNQSSGTYSPQIAYDFPVVQLAPLYSSGSASARSVNISAGTTVFSKQANSAVYEPSTITLTAIVQNISSPTYQWAYNNGTSWVDLSGETASTLTVSNSAFTTPSRVYRVEVGSPAVYGFITLLRVESGFGYMHEHSMPIPVVQCNALGTPKAGELGSSGRVTTTIRAFKLDGTELTATSGTPVAGQFRLSKLSDSGCVTTYSSDTIELTSISTEYGYTEYKIEYEGTANSISTFWGWTKTIDGSSGAGYNAVSGSSHTIGTGSKAFVTGGNSAYTAGMRVRIIDQANALNWMEGLITGISGGTITVLVDWISGSGTKSAWNITVVGEPGKYAVRAVLYKRAPESPTPSLPTTNVTFTYATQTCTGQDNGWSSTIPTSDGNPLWRTDAPSSSFASTDIISPGSWTAPVIQVKDGTAGAAAVLVRVTSPAQVFTRANSSASYSPSSITLTASIDGASASTYAWQYHNGTTWTTASGTTNLSTYTVSESAFTDARRYRCLINGTYFDEIQLFKVTGGTDGKTPYLENSNHNVPATSAGVVTSWTGADGYFKMLHGNTDVSSSCSFSIASNPSALTAAIHPTSGAYAVTGSGSWSNGSNTTKIWFRATYLGVNYDLPMTITKSLAGVAGTNGRGYNGTSTTSLAIGTGTKSWIMEPDLAYTAGMMVRIIADSDPNSFMEGQLTVYNSSTGSTSMTSEYFQGSGTFSAWKITNIGRSGIGPQNEGPYVSSNTYYCNSARYSVVFVGTTAYRANNRAKDGTNTWGTPGSSSDWAAPDTTVKFLASDFALIRDQIITRALQMGDNSTPDAGIIASAGSSTFSTGSGYYLNPRSSSHSNLAAVRFGDMSGQYLAWDGVNGARMNGSFTAGSGASRLTANSSGTFVGNTSGQHIAFPTLSGSNTVLAARYSSTDYATLGAYSLGGSDYAGQLNLYNSIGSSTGSLTSSSLNLNGSSIQRTGSLAFTVNSSITATGSGIFQLNGAGTINNFAVTRDVAVDVNWVNFRIFNTSNVQVYRVDATNGDVYRQGVKMLGGTDTGWTAMSGTSTKGSSYDTATITTAQLAGRVKALEDALFSRLMPTN